jgi:uncharacterized membrane protein YjfL (UPF0719 family)
MVDILQTMGWVALFTLCIGIVGMVLVFLATAFLPRLLDKLTPKIDEHKEIVRGNQAVAEYFGRIAGSCIVGVSLVIAAALIGGVLIFLK